MFKKNNNIGKLIKKIALTIGFLAYTQTAMSSSLPSRVLTEDGVRQLDSYSQQIDTNYMLISALPKLSLSDDASILSDKLKESVAQLLIVLDSNGNLRDLLESLKISLEHKSEQARRDEKQEFHKLAKEFEKKAHEIEKLIAIIEERHNEVLGFFQKIRELKTQYEEYRDVDNVDARLYGNKSNISPKREEIKKELLRIRDILVEIWDELYKIRNAFGNIS